MTPGLAETEGKGRRPIAGILLPTYNRPELLRLSLESAVRQEGVDFRVIVIDNAPSAEISGIVGSFRDARVRYVPNPRDIGLSGSINKGIELLPSEVEWVTVLADDDLLDAKFLRSSLDTASRTGGMSAIDGRRTFIDKEGRKIRDSRRPPAVSTAIEYLKGRARFLRDSYLTGVLFRTAAFRKAGGYPVFATGGGTDDAFLFSLALIDPIRFSPAAGASIRIHEGAESIRSSDSLRHLRAIEDLAAYIRSAIRRPGIMSPRERETVERYLLLYVAFQGDLQWARAAANLPAAGPDREEAMEALIAAARQYPVTGRTRTNVALMGHFGVVPERSRLWKLFWTGVKAARLVLAG